MEIHKNEAVHVGLKSTIPHGIRRSVHVATSCTFDSDPAIRIFSKEMQRDLGGRV